MTTARLEEIRRANWREHNAHVGELVAEVDRLRRALRAVSHANYMTEARGTAIDALDGERNGG